MVPNGVGSDLDPKDTLFVPDALRACGSCTGPPFCIVDELWCFARHHGHTNHANVPVFILHIQAVHHQQEKICKQNRYSLALPDGPNKALCEGLVFGYFLVPHEPSKTCWIFQTARK